MSRQRGMITVKRVQRGSRLSLSIGTLLGPVLLLVALFAAFEQVAAGLLVGTLLFLTGLAVRVRALRADEIAIDGDEIRWTGIAGQVRRIRLDAKGGIRAEAQGQVAAVRLRNEAGEQARIAGLDVEDLARALSGSGWTITNSPPTSMGQSYIYEKCGRS